MRPSQHLRHCPRCGAGPQPPVTGDRFTCERCGYVLHFNPAVSVSAFIRHDDGRVLLIRRGTDPGRGRLAPPGGFVDIGETVETALAREIREEVGLELADVRFLCSATNDYVYKEVNYPVADLFFTARAVDPGRAVALDEVEGVCWMQPAEVDPGQFAFPSMEQAWQQYKTRSS